MNEEIEKRLALRLSDPQVQDEKVIGKRKANPTENGTRILLSLFICNNYKKKFKITRFYEIDKL
jgi:hypothetical protein